MRTPRAALTVLAAAGLLLAACGGGGGEAAMTEDSPAGEEPAAELATARFRVDGMTCGGCALATEMAVGKLDGVEDVEASYDDETEEGRCTVEYDASRVTTEEIAGAIREAGFEPTLQGREGADR